MPEIQPLKPNPLKKYFRQPKLFLKLPSGGNYYPTGSIDLPENGELPVFPMTAKDELIMKTPDALLNGTSTVEVIQSCVPNIKDAWNMPSTDLDAVLIAIRIASYGSKLEITTKVPGVGTEKDFQIDLDKILAQLTSSKFINQIEVDDMIVRLKPLSYKEFTNSSLQTLEEQRVFRLATNNDISEEERLSRFNASFQKLTQLTVSMLSQSIHSITVEDTEVTDKLHIQEFIDNADKTFYQTILDHLEEQKNSFSVKPMDVKATPEEIEQGAPETYQVPITFDQSNFFA